jgi:tRNA-dihydrouridine synthase A
MVTTGALLHGDVARHLGFNAEEHSVALQLGGGEPNELARCARLAQAWGYDEINLNCGCPSERVQRGSFGACLMAEPLLVRDCVKAICDAAALPVSVKHRVGVDREERYEFVRDFLGTVAEGGCRVFLVHARNAWLKGLSPKQNREVPPLRHDLVARLKREFPSLTIVVNGGIDSAQQIEMHLAQVDGVMIGRAAYHDPWSMAEWDVRFLGAESPAASRREDVEDAMVRYMEREATRHGTPWPSIARHMMGLRHGTPGARRWRQVWSDHRLKGEPPRAVWALAQRAAPAIEQPPEPSVDATPIDAKNVAPCA